MIQFVVIPLLWVCPGLRFPVLGEVGGAMIAKTPSRNLLCQPSPGAPERFDHINDAMARIKELGQGATLAVCDPGMVDCVKQDIAWDSNPSLDKIKK